MTRVERVIKGFNNYDNLVKSICLMLDGKDYAVVEPRVNSIRDEISLLVSELTERGCESEC